MLPKIVGERYSDASGLVYGPLVRQPILIFGASKDELMRTLQRARQRALTPSIYTVDLFTTYNDTDNRATVAAVATEKLDIAGLALHGERKVVDKVVKGLKLHP
jgi:hypothetical protein